MEQNDYGERSVESMAGSEEPDIEYRYIVHVRAAETFFNWMERDGTLIPHSQSQHLRFSWPKLLDMKSLKERGLIWSYSVIQVQSVENVVEEG